MRLRHAKAVALAVAIACVGGFGCATTAVRHTVDFPPLPHGDVASTWTNPLLARAATELYEDLSARGPASLIERRIHGDDLDAYYTESGRSRIEHVIPGLTPRASERRWPAIRSLGGSAVVGWCARGVRVAEANGAEGFRGRVLTVDRLLIVGQEAEGRWGMWIEGLVYTRDGWRFVPTVPYGDAVQVPRRGHTDVELWDCDLGARPN